MNQDVQGALIERLSGMTFGAFLEQRLFRPLGMKDTGFDVPEHKLHRLAKTYKLVDGKFIEDKPILETWPENGRGIEAGGFGLFSTAPDFARFAQMLLNGGTLNGKRILGRKTIELMTANHMVTLPNNQAATRQKGFGLGVEVTTDLGQLSIPSSSGNLVGMAPRPPIARSIPGRTLSRSRLRNIFRSIKQFFARFQTGYYQALK